MISTAIRLALSIALTLAFTAPDVAAQTREVPDVVGDGSKTAQQIIDDNADENFAIVKKRPTLLTKIVKEQSPQAGKVLSVGEVIHLYVGGSGGAGEALDEAPILWVPIILLLLTAAWALSLRSRVNDLQLQLAKSNGDDDDDDS